MIISEFFLISYTCRLRRFARKEKHSTDKSKSSEVTGESSGMAAIPEKEDAGDIIKESEDEGITFTLKY